MDINALTQQAASALLSVTARTLRDWEKEGDGLPRNADGTYPGPALVSWFAAKQGGDGLDLNAERARLAKWQADKTEQEVESRAGELIKKDEVVSWVANMITIVKARLLQIPDAVGQLFEPKQSRLIASEVRRLIDDALAELTVQRPGARFVDEPLDAAAESEGERVGGSEAKALNGKQRRTRPVAN